MKVNYESRKGGLYCTIGRIRRVIKIKFKGKSCADERGYR